MENNEEVKPKKKRVPLLILTVVLIIAAVFGINKYVYSLHHEDTDDAQVDADINPVLPRISGYVNEIRFEDNQQVNKGDTLMLLDDRDLRIKVLQAQAALDNAMANVAVVKANVSTAHATASVTSSNAEAAKARAWKANQDYDRYQNLIKENAVTQQQVDAAKTEKLTADAQLESAIRQHDAAALQEQAASYQVEVARSTVAQHEADLEYAKLQQGYATIVAPSSGLASKKNVQPGQFVNSGTPLFVVVSGNGSFVIANFKETQLNKMKTGLPVEIKVDAYPDEVIHGTVYSFSAVTGAKFSLLPPDNATGNFVKVVQRIPVKIKLDVDNAMAPKLRAGMSVRVSVLLD